MYSQDATNDKQFQGINRTICIGLGGTGRDVLMRIRRLIVDRYSHLENLPVVSFVHIDTDQAATQAVTLRSGNIYRGVDLGFQESEKVGATMTATEVSNLVQGLEQCRTNPERPSPYKNIDLWFPPQLLRDIQAIDQGAKGIRPVGRLAFFHNYSKIRTALENAEQRTRGHEETLLQKWGLIVDPGLNIFVVGSLCGGTGSGTFLDMAYSLRSAYPGVQIMGYFVISPELYGNTPNMCANTYAALMELDYYSRPGTQFDACYEQRNLMFVREKRPPFDYTYLVSKDTEQGKYSITKQRKLCNVIAQKIALDFAGEIAPAVKGMRDNFAQHMLQEDDHPRPNTQRYLTFGLAAIYFPRERISQITITRISSTLVQFWLEGEGQSPDPKKVLDRFLIESRWHTDLDLKDGFIRKLEETPLEGEKAFTALMNNWRSRLEKTITDCKTKDDRSNLMRQLQRDFRDQFRKSQWGDTETTRGAWLTRLINNSKRIAEKFESDINTFLVNLLAPSNPSFSLVNARNWLDALRTELDEYQYKLSDRVRGLNNAWNLEDVEKKWSQVERSIQDIEAEFNLPLMNTKTPRVQEQAKKALKDTIAAIKHNFDYAAALEALEIVKALQQKIQKQVSDLTALVSVTEEIKSNYSKDEIRLMESNSDEMSGEEIFDNPDIQACYNELLPEKELRSRLVEIADSILELTGKEKSLNAFLDYNRPSAPQLQQAISLTVSRFFGGRSAGIVQSVIKRFNLKYPLANRPVRLAQILREAEPLLPLNLSDRYFYNNPAKKSKLIGFKNSSDRDVQDFQTLLTQNLGVPDNVLKPIQAEDEILIVTEYAGFPLRLINNLEQLKTHYLREVNTVGNTALHNDRHNLFTEIIPPDVSILQSLQDVFYPCLAFNLILQNPETKQLEFQYYDDLRGKHYPASLSPSWNQALEQLVKNSLMAMALRELLDRAIAEITHQSEQWEGYYLPKLRQFVDDVDNLSDDDINYPYRSIVVGSRGTADMPAKEGVIDRFLKQMQQRVKALPANRTASSAIAASQEVTTGEIVTPFDSVSYGSYGDSREGNGQNVNVEDVVTQLEKLASLKERGILSEAEFQAAKRRILGS